MSTISDGLAAQLTKCHVKQMFSLKLWKKFYCMKLGKDLPPSYENNPKTGNSPPPNSKIL